MADAPSKLQRASQAELEAARQMLDLRVNEVSPVDRPANRRRFLVIKNETNSVKAQADAGAERLLSQNAKKEENIQMADTSAIVKMLESAGFTMTSKALPDVLKSDVGNVSGLLQKMIAEKADMTPEQKSTLNNVATLLAEMGAGNMPSAEMPKKKAAVLDPTEKDEGDTTTVKIDGDVTTITTKGAAQKFKKNNAMLTAATKANLVLLRDADLPAFKSVIAEVCKELTGHPYFTQGVLPSSEGPTPSTTITTVKRDEKDAEELRETKAALQAVTKRLEKIEAERPASTSPSDAPTVPVKKNANLWSGVLF